MAEESGTPTSTTIANTTVGAISMPLVIESPPSPATCTALSPDDFFDADGVSYFFFYTLNLFHTKFIRCLHFTLWPRAFFVLFSFDFYLGPMKTFSRGTFFLFCVKHLHFLSETRFHLRWYAKYKFLYLTDVYFNKNPLFWQNVR